MNKRGFTLNLEFLLDLLLGILLGLVLLYFIVLLYGFFTAGKEKAMAEGTLSSIETATKEISLEQPAKLPPLVVPRGWYLMSFERGVNSEKKDVLPQTFCADENCLCICKPTKFLGLIQISVDCRKNAECKIFTNPFKENGKDLYIKIPQQKDIEITNLDSSFKVEKK